MLESFELARSSMITVYKTLGVRDDLNKKIGRAIIDLDRCIRVMEKEKNKKTVEAIKQAFEVGIW